MLQVRSVDITHLSWSVQNVMKRVYTSDGLRVVNPAYEGSEDEKSKAAALAIISSLAGQTVEMVDGEIVKESYDLTEKDGVMVGKEDRN